MKVANYLRGAAALIAVGTLTGCPGPGPKPPPKVNGVAFVKKVNQDLVDINREANAAGWTMATDITVDTQFLNSKATDRYLEFFSRKAGEARAYDKEKLDPATERAIKLIKIAVSAPAPADAAKRSELATLSTELDAMYGEGKYCPPGTNKDGKGEGCKNLDELSDIIAHSRNYQELTEAWVGWHTISKPMRAKYQRFVELSNEGARELGFADVGDMWRSKYDMPAADFEKEAARLYDQVKPLYQGLHCYTRKRLAQRYGKDKVPDGKPIPAQLLGNMWAQQWNNVYDDLLKPYPAASIESADRLLQKQKWDAVRMTKSAESFYTSIGFPALPQTFWDRSMLVRPRDREVQCHASAWDMDDKDDVRIKMCMKPTEEDLFTIYHELGHVYYYIWYKDQPQLFQDGAHDGFHEAIGDTVNLSVTPAYLRKIGLVGDVVPSKEAIINQQMKMALDKVAFLPFGKLIDEWRWGVFDGRIKPSGVQQGLVGSAREVPGRFGAGGAQRRGFRSGREVPRAGQHVVHALFPVVHRAVPVPQGAVRRVRIQGPAVRMLDLRQHRGRREIRGDAQDWRQPALAGLARAVDRYSHHGRLGHHGILSAARRLARRTEQERILRLELRSR